LPSAIDEKLTKKERLVLAAYRAGSASDMRRAIRLSVQYAVGAGIFVVLALTEREPLWALAVYAVLILVLVTRILGGRAVAGSMPSVIEKYEQEILALRQGSGTVSE
jgi:hypothetical protein